MSRPASVVIDVEALYRALGVGGMGLVVGYLFAGLRRRVPPRLGGVNAGIHRSLRTSLVAGGVTLLICILVPLLLTLEMRGGLAYHLVEGPGGRTLNVSFEGVAGTVLAPDAS